MPCQECFVSIRFSSVQVDYGLPYRRPQRNKAVAAQIELNLVIGALRRSDAALAQEITRVSYGDTYATLHTPRATRDTEYRLRDYLQSHWKYPIRIV